MPISIALRDPAAASRALPATGAFEQDGRMLDAEPAGRDSRVFREDLAVGMRVFRDY